MSSIQTARLTLVDLAGSERTKHTQTSGERLREAGNINKSLMVLGQCMETLRANQRTLARSLAPGVGGRTDTRDVKRGLAVVPFRHSKLTEILMDYFVGEGRAVRHTRTSHMHRSLTIQLSVCIGYDCEREPVRHGLRREFARDAFRRACTGGVYGARYSTDANAPGGRAAQQRGRAPPSVGHTLYGWARQESQRGAPRGPRRSVFPPQTMPSTS